MSPLWDVTLVGCHTNGMSPQWDVTSVGCHLYGMSLLWDVTPVECHCQPRCHPEHRCHPRCGLIPGGMSPWSRMAPQLKTSLRLRTLTWMGTSPQWDVPDGDTVPGRTLLYSMGSSPQCPTLHGDITPEGLTTLLHRAVTLHGDVTPLPPPPWGHHSAMCHHLHGAVSLPSSRRAAGCTQLLSCSPTRQPGASLSGRRQHIQ